MFRGILECSWRLTIPIDDWREVWDSEGSARQLARLRRVGISFFTPREVSAHFDNSPVHDLIVVPYVIACLALHYFCAPVVCLPPHLQPLRSRRPKRRWRACRCASEENRGQWDASVRFTARSNGVNLQLTDRGPAFLVGSSRVQIDLVHASASPVIQPLGKLPAATNYLVGAAQPVAYRRR